MGKKEQKANPDAISWEQKLGKFPVPNEEEYRRYLASYLGNNSKAKLRYDLPPCMCKCILSGTNSIGNSRVELRFLLDTLLGQYDLRKSYHDGKRQITETIEVAAGKKGEIAGQKISKYTIFIKAKKAKPLGNIWYSAPDDRNMGFTLDASGELILLIYGGDRLDPSVEWDSSKLRSPQFTSEAAFGIIDKDLVELGIGSLTSLISHPLNTDATLRRFMDLSWVGVKKAKPPSIALTV